MLFSGLHAAAVETPIYSFLEWREKPGKACGLVFAYIFLCVPLIHGIIFGIFCLRCYFVNRINKRSSRSQNEDFLDRNGTVKNENTQNNVV